MGCKISKQHDQSLKVVFRIPQGLEVHKNVQNVIQDGQVEVVSDEENHEVQLAVLGKNEVFGEMAIFEHDIRSASVRALGPARILTVDHKSFLHRIHEDPSLAYHLMEVMSNRVRRLTTEVTHLKQV